MELDVARWWIGQSPPLHEMQTQFVQVMHMDRVHPEWAQSHCTLLPEVGWLGAWEMSYVCMLSLSERRKFSFNFGSQVLAAALYQLMVMLGLDGYLVTGCPHTMGLTLGAKFVLQLLSLPLLGNGSCSGPMVGVDRKLWNWQLGWKEWYLFCIQLTNNDHQNERRERKKIIMKVKGRTLQWTRANLKQ